MGKDLVLVGGGHAHMSTIAGIRKIIDKGHRVTVIGPSPYHYYSGMGPGMLGGLYRPDEIRFPIKERARDRGAVFIEDRVLRIRPRNRELLCASGRVIAYDVVSFNVGSHVPDAIVSRPFRNILPVKPIENLYEGRRKIRHLIERGVPRIVTVGGGPAAVEVAGNIAGLVKGKGDVEMRILAGGSLLSGMPEKARDIATRSLLGRGVDIVEGPRTRLIDPKGIDLEDGRRISYDVCFLAVGVRPSGLFRKSKIRTGEDGGLAVNPYLQSVQHPEIFGGGDCIHFLPGSLEKVGVYAVRQNPVLYHNLLAALEGRPLKPFVPGRKYFLILNLGDGRGLFRYHHWVWAGKTAFLIKDRIDRNFIRKFS